MSWNIFKWMGCCGGGGSSEVTFNTYIVQGIIQGEVIKNTPIITIIPKMISYHIILRL